MLVTHQERPRELKWYHAGPMLYGDWGTSRFYVLGLAFFYALHASFWYVCGVGVLVAAVGWAYTIICKCYPDGGGVYSAAKHTSKNLAVVGALLLFADYIVTAALSALDGMHYLGIPEKWVALAAIGSIVLIGLINFIGPKKAGTFALIVALSTLVLTVVLTIFTIPHLAEGWHNIHRPAGTVGHQWLMLVNVVLALSGVEAIANMTGIMVPPVAKTSKKAIWPVLIEVVVFNIILAIGMNALPNTTSDGKYDRPAAEYAQADAQIENYQKLHPEFEKPEGKAAYEAFEATVGQHSTDRENDIKNKVLRVMGDVFIGHWFAWISGIVFGLLLLSAVNTAVADMVSIQYVMSRDTELPHTLTRLNVFGVPWIALIPAIGLPVLILSMTSDLESLADLYAIGVVGAIGINLGSCCANKTMPLKKYERVGMGVLAVIMGGIEITLAYQKPPALVFAGSVLTIGLMMRFATKSYPKLRYMGRAWVLGATAVLLVAATAMLTVRQNMIAGHMVDVVPFVHTITGAAVLLLLVGALLLLTAGSSVSTAVRYVRMVRRGEKGPMARVEGAGVIGMREAAPYATAPSVEGIQGTPGQELEMDRPHVMVATRGALPLLEFAASYTKDVRGIMFVLYVRQINVAFSGPVEAPGLEEDEEARRAFAVAAEVAKKVGVPMVPIYVVSSEVVYTILDFAATYSVKALLMGVSRKGTLLRALQGDVITNVADNLPNDIPLLIHA